MEIGGFEMCFFFKLENSDFRNGVAWMELKFYYYHGFQPKKHLRKPMQYSVARLVYVRSCRQCSVSHVVCTNTVWITDS